jgi:tRNA pseudouridine32 synthase / 23S rRNA pseudouridine746 synthase
MPVSIDELQVLPPCSREIKILMKDKDFLIIEKPQGLLSVPGRHPQNHDSVISRLLHDYPLAAIVHRLDFDTSGVMVIPLNQQALSHISKQFQARQVNKHYLAVVAGIIEQDKGVIDLPIAKGEGPKYIISRELGKASMTEYEVLQRDTVALTTRVWLNPLTGRSHQLRLHLSAIGHPILGCVFYGGHSYNDKSAASAPRLLLHATDLTFKNPSTGMSVFCECPSDF